MSLIIDTADIIAVRGKGLLSAGIAALTGPISHIGGVTSFSCGHRGCTDFDHVMVTQALSTIKTVSLKETLAACEYGYVLHCKSLTDDQREAIAAWVLKQVGTPYPVSNLFWQAAKQITSNPKFTEYMDRDHEEICSQLWALGYLEAASMDFGESPRDIDPTDVFHYAMGSADWVVQPPA